MTTRTGGNLPAAAADSTGLVSANRPSAAVPTMAVADFDRDAFAAVIGELNTAKYLEKFERFHGGGGRLAWHWPAFFIAFVWLLYRKQWLYALAYLIASAILQIGVGVIGLIEPSIAGAANVAMLLLMFVGPALLADRVYYRHCRQLIAKTQAAARNRDEQIGLLKGRGGTSRVAMIFFVIIVFIAIIGNLAAVALPAYQQYVAKAKIAEAALVARQATASVEIYHRAHQRFPATLQGAGLATALPTHVASLMVDPETGALTAEVTLSSADKATGHLVLTPSVQADQSITWTCGSPDLKPELLPADCRAGAR